MYARVSCFTLKISCQLISLSIRTDLLLDRDISADIKPMGGSILRHPDDYPFAGRLVCAGVPQVLVYPCLINSSFLLTEKAMILNWDLGSNSYLIFSFFFMFLKMNLFIIIRANYFKILWWILPYIEMNQPQVYMGPCSKYLIFLCACRSLKVSFESVLNNPIFECWNCYDLEWSQLTKMIPNQ